MVRYFVLLALCAPAFAERVTLFQRTCAMKPISYYVYPFEKPAPNLRLADYAEHCAGRFKLTQQQGSYLVRAGLVGAWNEMVTSMGNCLEISDRVCRTSGGISDRKVPPLNPTLTYLTSVAWFMDSDGEFVSVPNSNSKFVACGIVVSESVRPATISCNK